MKIFKIIIIVFIIFCNILFFINYFILKDMNKLIQKEMNKDKIIIFSYIYGNSNNGIKSILEMNKEIYEDENNNNEKIICYYNFLEIIESEKYTIIIELENRKNIILEFVKLIINYKERKFEFYPYNKYIKNVIIFEITKKDFNQITKYHNNLCLIHIFTNTNIEYELNLKF